MKDFNNPLRKAIFDTLNGQITYDGSVIPINDQKQRREYENTNYIIISNIRSVGNDTFHGWSRLMNFDLDIVTKTTNSVSSEIADTIAEQCLELLMPSVGAVGMTVPPEFNYINLLLNSDQYIEFELTATGSLLRRLLGFKIQVDQI